MGALGNIIGNAVDAVSGSSSGTTLQNFLDKFTSSSGRYVDTLDPLGTFDVKFKFFPTVDPTEDKSGWGARLGQSLVNSGVSALKNTADNLTGGIFSSLTEGGKDSIKKAHNEFKYAGEHTFMEYLAQANLLQGGEQWQNSEQANCPLELNLGPYVQEIRGLNMKMGNEGKSQTLLGEFPINGNYVQAEGTLGMTILNTKAALHERIFYPWMREITLPFWSYEKQPYTTANVEIDFTKHNDVKYVFCGVRPVQIKLLDAKQDADSANLEREVTFAYDFMFITSDLNVNDSVGQKLMGTAGGLLGNAAGMLNF